MTNTNETVQLVQPHEIKNPHLSPMQAAALLMAMNSALLDTGDVYVSLTYPKQTETKPRVAGKDYPVMPGVSPDAQMGKLSVHRRVDNKRNRKLGVVGEVYCKVASYTRGDGQKPVGFTNVRPNDVTGFAVTGFVPREDGVRPQREEG